MTNALHLEYERLSDLLILAGRRFAGLPNAEVEEDDVLIGWRKVGGTWTLAAADDDGKWHRIETTSSRTRIICAKVLPRLLHAVHENAAKNRIDTQEAIRLAIAFVEGS